MYVIHQASEPLILQSTCVGCQADRLVGSVASGFTVFRDIFGQFWPKIGGSTIFGYASKHEYECCLKPVA